MNIYLVQHGEADSKENNPQRPLTARGHEEVRCVAEFAKRIGVRIAEIRHSGKLRAAQTAEIFGKLLEPPQGVAALSGLGPMDEVGPIAKALSEEDDNVMLVGHLPFMERLATVLVLGKAADHPVVRFQKGGVVCLQRDNGRWVVTWMITPDLLQEPSRTGC